MSLTIELSGWKRIDSHAEMISETHDASLRRVSLNAFEAKTTLQSDWLEIRSFCLVNGSAWIERKMHSVRHPIAKGAVFTISFDIYPSADISDTALAAIGDAFAKMFGVG